MRLFDRDLGQRKQFRAGTHRSRSPAETLAAYLPLAPAMGITRLPRITGLDHIGLPVYACVRPNARALATSQGKGVDDVSAKVSALMESIEAWHAERIELPARRATARELARTGAVIDVGGLPVPRSTMVRDDAPMWWIQGWDLLGEQPMWVPHEAVSLDFVYAPGYRPTFLVSSNGLASGNHPLEAISHGLLEVIERDAEAAWRVRSEIATTALDLDGIDDPLCRSVLDLLARAGIAVAVHDISSDVGVPAYQCTIYHDHDPWRPVGPGRGTGCHPAPEIAVLRALTEAVQARVTMIAGSRDDMFYRDYAQFTDARVIAAIAKAASQDRPRRALRDRVSLATETFEGDLEVMLARLRAAGATSAVAVELTRPELQIPVWKVIVPRFEQPIQTGEVRGWRHTRDLA